MVVSISYGYFNRFKRGKKFLEVITIYERISIGNTARIYLSHDEKKVPFDRNLFGICFFKIIEKWELGTSFSITLTYSYTMKTSQFNLLFVVTYLTKCSSRIALWIAHETTRWKSYFCNKRAPQSRQFFPAMFNQSVGRVSCK